MRALSFSGPTTLPSHLRAGPGQGGTALSPLPADFASPLTVPGRTPLSFHCSQPIFPLPSPFPADSPLSPLTVPGRTPLSLHGSQPIPPVPSRFPADPPLSPLTVPRSRLGLAGGRCGAAPAAALGRVSVTGTPQTAAKQRPNQPQKIEFKKICPIKQEGARSVHFHSRFPFPQQASCPRMAMGTSTSSCIFKIIF